MLHYRPRLVHVAPESSRWPLPLRTHASLGGDCGGGVAGAVALGLGVVGAHGGAGCAYGQPARHPHRARHELGDPAPVPAVPAEERVVVPAAHHVHHLRRFHWVALVVPVALRGEADPVRRCRYPGVPGVPVPHPQAPSVADLALRPAGGMPGPHEHRGHHLPAPDQASAAADSL